MKDWDLEMSFEPDEIEAKILPRPSILDMEVEGKLTGKKSLDDLRILNSMVY